MSISGMDICSNGICNFTQVAALSIPLTKGAGSCIELIPPDGISDSVQFNFTVDHAYFRWDAVSKYYTDDPAIDPRGFCSCPGGTAISCTSSSIEPEFRDVEFCATGIHTDSYCPLIAFGRTGTYVVRIGLDANTRFAVLEMSNVVKLDVGIIVTVSTTNYSFIGLLNYVGSPASVLSPGGEFGVDLLTDTASPTYFPKHLVFDKAAPNNYYLMEDSQVNGINDFDIRKIGWNKVTSFRIPFFGHRESVQVPSNLGALTPVRVKNCKKNEFDVTIPWINQADMLGNSSLSLSGYKAPGSFFVDADYPLQISGDGAPNHFFEPYYYMADGVIFENPGNGAPTFFGRTQDGMFTPSLTQQMSLTNFSMYSGGKFLMSQDSPILRYQGITGTGPGTPFTDPAVITSLSNLLLPTNMLAGSIMPAFCPTAIMTTDPSWWRQRFGVGASASSPAVGIWAAYMNQQGVFPGTNITSYCSTVSSFSSGYAPVNLGTSDEPNYVEFCDSTGLVAWGFYTLNNATTYYPSVDFIATAWPEIRLAEFNWNGTGWIKEYVVDNLTNQSYLLTPLSKGSILGSFKFKNFQLRVDVANIRPVIKSLKVVGTSELRLEAYSATVGGTAYVSTSPADMIVPRPVTLSPSPQVFVLDVNRPSFNGTITVFVVAGVNSVSATAELAFDNRLSYQATAESFIKATDPVNFWENWDNLLDTDLGLGTRVTSFFYMALQIVLLALGAVIGILFVYKVVQCVRGLKTRRKSTDSRLKYKQF